MSDLLDSAAELTPIQEIDDILFKRDDLFCPFGEGNLNGGKLRQGISLLSQAKIEGFARAITGCSLLSAQAPIVAAVSQQLGMECLVLYGGTSKKTLFEKHHMPRLVKHFGAEIEMVSSGRSNVLLHRAKQIQREKDFIVEYGVNSNNPNYFVSFYATTAAQVQNLPDELKHLVIDCGSGITAAGVLYGLAKYNKKVENVWVVGTAPTRKKKIKDRLAFLSVLSGIDCWNVPFNYVDLYNQGVKYEDKVKIILENGTKLHQNYEGKVYRWLKEHKLRGSICFWIIGGPIKFLA